MLDEKFWNFDKCNIGGPCAICVENCSFRKVTYSRDNGQEEKEKKNERIFEGDEERN